MGSGAGMGVGNDIELQSIFKPIQATAAHICLAKLFASKFTGNVKLYIHM